MRRTILPAVGIAALAAVVLWAAATSIEAVETNPEITKVTVSREKRDLHSAVWIYRVHIYGSRFTVKTKPLIDGSETDARGALWETERDTYGGTSVSALHVTIGEVDMLEGEEGERPGHRKRRHGVSVSDERNGMSNSVDVEW